MRADGDVPADRPEREDAVGLAVAGDQRDGLFHRGVAASSLRRIEEPQQHLGLALPGEAGKADDLAPIGGELAPVLLDGRARRAPVVLLRSAWSSSAALSPATSRATLPIAATSESRVNLRGRPFGDRPCRRA